MTVRMALAEALHHSCGVEPSGPNEALRGQKTASAAGTRPGVLKDPAPQGAVTVGYVAAPGPLLSTPSFADSMADSVDDRAVQILLQLALKKKEEEDEEERRRAEEEKHERRMQRLNQKVGHDMPLTEAEWAAWRQWVVKLPSPSSSAGTKRKRKKRRKKKAPKTSSSHSSHSRARRRQRQWHARSAGHQLPRRVLLRQGGRCLRCAGRAGFSGAGGGRDRRLPLLQLVENFVGFQHPCRGAEADPHGPDYSADHRDSSVAVRSQVVDALAVQVVRFYRLYISVYSALLGSTVDTNLRRCTKNFTFFT